jgi:hypothetical protein
MEAGVPFVRCNRVLRTAISFRESFITAGFITTVVIARTIVPSHLSFKSSGHSTKENKGIVLNFKKLLFRDDSSFHYALGYIVSQDKASVKRLSSVVDAMRTLNFFLPYISSTASIDHLMDLALKTHTSSPSLPRLTCSHIFRL